MGRDGQGRRAEGGAGGGPSTLSSIITTGAGGTDAGGTDAGARSGGESSSSSEQRIFAAHALQPGSSTRSLLFQASLLVLLSLPLPPPPPSPKCPPQTSSARTTSPSPTPPGTPPTGRGSETRTRAPSTSPPQKVRPRPPPPAPFPPYRTRPFVPPSERPLPCSMQIFQGRLLHRRLFLPLLPPGPRARPAKGSMRVVRQGKLQVWPQVRPRTRPSRSEHVHGPQEQEGRSARCQRRRP